MNTTNPQEIYNEFLKILALNNDAKMEEFLEKNLLGLPQEFQDKITMALFEDAVHSQAAGEEALANFKKDGLDMLKKLKTAKKDFEDIKKAEEIKSQM